MTKSSTFIRCVILGLPLDTLIPVNILLVSACASILDKKSNRIVNRARDIGSPYLSPRPAKNPYGESFRRIENFGVVMQLMIRKIILALNPKHFRIVSNTPYSTRSYAFARSTLIAMNASTILFYSDTLLLYI